MSNDDENKDDRGAIVMEPAPPRRGRFTLLIPDSLCFEVKESGNTLRLDFRPRTLRERAELWRRRWGL